MRVRPVPLLAAVFGSAAATAAFVVLQIHGSHESGAVPPPAPAPMSARSVASPAPPAGTGTLEGTVRDPAGHPLAGVDVRATVRADPLRPFTAGARTDFEGRFRLDGLAAGRTEIVATAPGALAGASRAVEVHAGRIGRVEVELTETGVLAGRVRSGADRARGLTVVAVARTGGAAARQVARVPVDETGGYRLALPAGEYRVHAGAGDGADADARTAPAFARVEPGRTSRLDLDAAAAAREDAVDVLVVEPGGAPAAGAVVTLSRAGDGRIALATTAGPDGRVAIGSRMGLTGHRVAIRARSGGRTGTESVALPSSGAVEVRLSPACTIEGAVRGARIAGFTLEVSSAPEEGGWRTFDVRRFDGERFALEDLPPEPLRLVVRTSDGRRGSADVRLGPGERAAIEIAVR
jgi:hypothetical protein